MYEFFKQAIETKSYHDLNAFLAKLRAAWGRELLTERARGCSMAARSMKA